VRFTAFPSRPGLPLLGGEGGQEARLHVGALGASDGLEALERLALVFKPEK
jgi:hypothetical protein